MDALAGPIQGQRNSLKLNLRDNNGDAAKVRAFLNKVNTLFHAGHLTLTEAETLLGSGNSLLRSITRR